MKHYDDLLSRLRSATKLPMLQALMNEAADAIQELTAADVRPVVLGKWVRASRRNIHCSVCGELALGVRWWEGDLEESNFCPNCGADMREES